MNFRKYMIEFRSNEKNWRILQAHCIIYFEMIYLNHNLSFEIWLKVYDLIDVIFMLLKKLNMQNINIDWKIFVFILLLFLFRKI